MILWFTVLQIVLACAAGLTCLVLGLAGRVPSDVSVGAMAVVELALLAQVVVAIVAPFSGNPPSGDLLESWMYLVSAVLLPIAAVVWGFVERGRWSTVVMGVVGLALAVMVWRMHVIWTIQIA